MRTDGGLDPDYINAGDWKDKKVRGLRYSTLEVEMVDGKRKVNVHSLSGNERNKLFWNTEGKFDDVSLWSGTDSIADGRCFAVWDYDHDGHQDIALLNMNTPHLQILRNEQAHSNTSPNGFVAVRLVGGNTQAVQSSQWSARNGIGAMVTVETDAKSLVRELRCGEGFSSQNSSTLLIGFGDCQVAKSISVRWPSGTVQKIGQIKSGSLVTFFENPDMSENSEPYLVTSYDRATPAPNQELARDKGPFSYQLGDLESDDAQLKVMITMATWCSSCKKHLAPIARLKDSLHQSSVSFFAIPVDETDNSEKLNEYAQRHNVPYQILHEMDASDRRLATQFIEKQLGSVALPCTIVTDQQGNPLHVQFGIPAVSDIRRIQASLDRKNARQIHTD